MYKWIIKFNNDEGQVIKFIKHESSVFEHQAWMPEEGTYTFEVIDISNEEALEECHAKRKAEYGPIELQLDEMYHDWDAWRARIAAIKAKYPKPQ